MLLQGEGIDDPTVSQPQYDDEVISIAESMQMTSPISVTYAVPTNDAMVVTTEQLPLARLWPLQNVSFDDFQSQSVLVGSPSSTTENSSEAMSSLYDTTPDLSDASSTSPIISRRHSFQLSASSLESTILEEHYQQIEEDQSRER